MPTYLVYIKTKPIFLKAIRSWQHCSQTFLVWHLLNVHWTVIKQKSKHIYVNWLVKMIRILLLCSENDPHLPSVDVLDQFLVAPQNVP